MSLGIGINETTVSMFFRKRDVTEVDLVKITEQAITEVLSATAAKTFLSSPTIMSIKDLNPNAQRVTINKYFGDNFLIARSSKDIIIKDAFPLLINDGTDQDWATIIRTVILPFIKTNHIKLHIL